MRSEELEPGDLVYKFSGDYGGWGVVQQILSTLDGRVRYLVAYSIAGPDAFGSILHINNRNQLKTEAEYKLWWHSDKSPAGSEYGRG